MELFTIERYEGDNINKEGSDNENLNESQKLAQLIQQARGRKRSRKSSNKKEDNEVVVGESQKMCATVPEASKKVKNGGKKKGKRSKLEHANIEEMSVENKKEEDTTKVLEESECIVQILIITYIAAKL